MKEKKYSKDIANAVNDFLTKDNWNFSFDDNLGIFKFILGIKGKMKRLSYYIDIKEDEFLVYAVSPLSADEDDAAMMANMAEFICRANYGLKMGNFEFDYSDGEIRYKVHIPCSGIIPTEEMIRDSIFFSQRMFKRYGSGIIDIIFNDCSAKEVYEKCEENAERELRDLLSELLAGEEESASEDENADAMSARLAARFGTSDETDQTSESTDDGEPKMDLFGKKGDSPE